MKKLLSLGFAILLLAAQAGAVMKHSLDTQLDYKKYTRLVQQYPDNSRYLFEQAMVMAYMGKIEEAGQQLKKISAKDEDYASKILKVLEKNRVKKPADWKNNFKLGFVYYFLFEEAYGRIELAQRRIKRATDHPKEFKPGTIEYEQGLIDQKTPVANMYKEKSLASFQKVAEKTPKDNLNAWGYAYMAVVRGIEKNWPEAEALCKHALDIEPDAYAIRAAYMEALKQNGKGAAAAGQMAIALRLKSEQEAYEKTLFKK